MRNDAGQCHCSCVGVWVTSQFLPMCHDIDSHVDMSDYWFIWFLYSCGVIRLVCPKCVCLCGVCHCSNHEYPRCNSWPVNRHSPAGCVGSCYWCLSLPVIPSNVDWQLQHLTIPTWESFYKRTTAFWLEKCCLPYPNISGMCYSHVSWPLHKSTFGPKLHLQVRI